MKYVQLCSSLLTNGCLQLQELEGTGEAIASPEGDAQGFPEKGEARRV